MRKKAGFSSAEDLRRRTLRKPLELSYFTFQGLLRNMAFDNALYECFAKELIDNALDADPTMVEISTLLSGEPNETLELRVTSDGHPFRNFRDVLTRFDVFSGTKFWRRPLRGVLGNALKVVAGAPFALAESLGGIPPSPSVTVETRGEAYHLNIKVDAFRGKIHPRFTTPVKTGSRHTSVTIRLPYRRSFGSYNIESLVKQYALFNPSVAFRYTSRGREISFYKRPRPHEYYKGLTSVHWYSLGDFSEFIKALATSGKRDSLRSLLGNLRGFTSPENQRPILRSPSPQTIQGLAHSRKQVKRFFELLRKYSEPPKPELLGALGKRNLRERLEEIYHSVTNFHYDIVRGVHKERDFEIPYVIEAAFCRVLGLESREIFFGINQSLHLGNPLFEVEHLAWKTERGKKIEASTLYEMLESFKVTHEAPNVLVVHIICPNLKVRDPAKYRYDFEPLEKGSLGQVVYNVIKKNPSERWPRMKGSLARGLLVQELERRHQILKEKGEIPIELWTTQQGLFYLIRGRMEGEIDIKRKSFTTALVDECRKLGQGDLSIRERLGIKAAVRAQLFFRGSEEAVSLEQVERLAKKGSDLLLCEKEGVAEVLEPYARRSGIAILNSRGFATDYVRQVLTLSKEFRGNVFLLTDLDASGLLLAQKLSGFKRIGIDLEMLNYLKEKGHLTGDPDRLWERYDTRTGEAPKNHWKKLSKEEQELVRWRRLEIDALMANVGSQHLWEAVKERINLVRDRDLTRSIQLSPSELIPDDLTDYMEQIRGYLEKRAEPLLKGELGPYENWTMGITDNIEDEESKVREAVKKQMHKDRSVQKLTKMLRNVIQKLAP